MNIHEMNMNNLLEGSVKTCQCQDMKVQGKLI